MRHSIATTKYWGAAAAASLLLGASPAAWGQTATVTYALDDVWLLPDVTHPWEAAQQMTGTFEWTYEEGDFENGSGEFIELSLPWWSDSLPPVAWIIEQPSLEITMPGKYHDLGVDVMLHFLEPLALDRASTIDTVLSAFEIQVGVARMGHVISGSIVPVPDACAADSSGDSVVDVIDLLSMLASWGPCAGCGEDINGDGTVDVLDLLSLLAAWGPCP